LLRAEQAEQKKMLLEAVETMKKTKKWEAPAGVNMDIDMEGIISKVHNERSAGTLPAIRPSASSADVPASSSAESRPKSRSKQLSDAARADDALPLPRPPAAEKTVSNTQPVRICFIQLQVLCAMFFSNDHGEPTFPFSDERSAVSSGSAVCFATKGSFKAKETIV
jgi:hypothetical protein